MTSPRDPTLVRHGPDRLTISGSPANPATLVPSRPQSAHRPFSLIQPYNPQEWGPSPAQMPEWPGHSMTENERALPPPPYSPPRSRPQRPLSTAIEQRSLLSSTSPPIVVRTTSLAQHSPSPELSGSTSFPAPPEIGTRATSRERPFGLPSLPNHTRNHEQPLFNDAPDMRTASLQIQESEVPSPLNQGRGPEQVAALRSGASVLVGPPAARRASSTGALGTPTSQRSRSTSHSRWEPGMPLPPPPPGPPPLTSRSQSVQSMYRSSVPMISPPTRRPPSGIASLGPVPPTPADWIDQDNRPSSPHRSLRGRSPGLIINTAIAKDATNVSEPTGSANSNGTLTRATAVRHDKTIVQRRAESKSRQTLSNFPDVSTAQPHNITDIVVPPSSGGSAGRPTMRRLTPSSERRDIELHRTGISLMHDSCTSTPRVLGSSQQETATPPFSSFSGKTQTTYATNTSARPKALPTPPSRPQSPSNHKVEELDRTPATVLTHIFDQGVVIGQEQEQFATASLERFRGFVFEEARAHSDADRVRLFANFVVNESRIRRERYSSAIGGLESEIFDLTRDLLRPIASPLRREHETSTRVRTPNMTGPDQERLDPVGSILGSEDNFISAPVSAREPASPTASLSNSNGNWATSYKPCLSPILSLSASDNNENGSSRGRASSRWWETDSQGEIGALERSQRESKYMGVPKIQWAERDHAVSTHSGLKDHEQSSDYPPEKTGCHDPGATPKEMPKLTQRSGTGPGSSAATPSMYGKPDGGLDVSRLVTMPPPYPRHHPAVNNSHPKLMAMRTSVRSLNDPSEIDQIKTNFVTESSKRRQDFFESASERRRVSMASLQKRVDSGAITHAEEAMIDSDSQERELSKSKDLEKEDYEKFQSEVVHPVNGLLTARIAEAGELLNALAAHLFDNGEVDADMPQEEGDERPELLEKLTLLKWIFETREFLHRSMYDILSERNDRYSELVLTPYCLSSHQEKFRSAQKFFTEDAAKRESSFAEEALERARAFRCIVEEAVERGVALQLSAFWDIAPPLRCLLDSIPSSLKGFRIQIPAFEYVENPAYCTHPLQYLCSLLMHMEKSTYQFIEAHTNLLCLLHEVQEAEANAKARALAASTQEADSTTMCALERHQRAQARRQDENRQLTGDLKEKVREVQDQWNSALGESIKDVKKRLTEWLISTGGWDETLEEAAVFSGL